MKNRFKVEIFFKPKILKFFGAGVINTVFGYSVYALLLYIKIPYPLALFIATVAGVVFNYISFGRIVFKSFGLRIFGKFIIAYALIYVLNVVLLKVVMEYLMLNPYLGQILCIPISVLLSWLLMNYWVYKND